VTSAGAHTLRGAVMDQTQMARVFGGLHGKGRTNQSMSAFMADVSARNYTFMSLKKTSDRIVSHYNSLVQEKLSKCKSVLMYRQI
jgi:hypothetical protein